MKARMFMFSILKFFKYLFILPLLLQAQEKPSWVENKPVSNLEFYVGIGESSILDKDYSLIAKQRALRSIASEINIFISSEFKSSIIEMNNEDDSETIETLVANTLTNFKGVIKKGEFVDTKNKTYYVYYEYEKSLHLENIESAKKRSISLINQYANLSSSSFVQRLQTLVNAYEELFNIYGEDVYTDVNGVNFNLQSFVPSEISRLIRQLVIQPYGQTQFKGVFQQGLNEELSFEVKAKINRTNIIEVFGLPFLYSFENGEGDFSFTNVRSDEFGYVTNGLLRINSNIPRQIISAKLDLSQLKNYQNDFYQLDQALEKLSEQKKINFNLDVSLVKSDRVSIWVKSEGISQNEARNINDQFEIAFKNITKFILIDRQSAEKILESKNLTSADVCDDSECRSDISRELGVDKFILVDIFYSLKSKTVTATMRYTGIDGVMDVKKPYDAKVKRGDYETAIKSNINDWVTDFYGLLNPPKINIASNIEDVRVSFGSDRYTLPLIDFELNPGNYTFIFEKNGYETKSRNEKLFPNDVCCDDVNLKPKTRLKAFAKSLILPGSGQRYGKDNRNQNVGRKSFLHTTANLLLTAGVAYAWYNFTVKQSDYDNAQLAYAQSTDLISIEKNRKAASVANDNMSQSYSGATSLTALMILFSLYSGIDAALTLPQY